jgi:DNA polymerase-3 subunit alpha
VSDSFAHLHLHTEFSMLDGAARVKDVVRTAAEMGHPGIGITDHGVMYGVVDFVKAATASDINPIVGVEAYVTPGSRFDRPARAENIRHHMILLAENDTGYHNLLQMVSRAFTEGYYYKPRMDFDLMAEYSEGIIATSGCLGGPVPQLLAPDASREEGNAGMERDFEGALKVAGRLQDIFGKDNFFIEVQDHGIEAQNRIMGDLLDISKTIGAPLLATNDAHYTRQSEFEAHDVLLCIQTGATIDEPDRFKFAGDQFYLKTAEQMRALFPDDRFPGACDNTLWVAERSNVELEFGKILLPHFPVPEGHDAESYLEELVVQGAKARYGDMLPTEVQDRIDHELKIISDMGFPAYFIIVWDLIRYAKERKIRTGPGRGSAAGSIVAYALEITDLDPIKYGLIFERFLNPGRREMPDIDMDFDERYRADVIRYASEKYGSDHVAQIITFSTIKGKQAIRDSARVLGLPYNVGDKVAKMMPGMILGKDATLSQCLEEPGPDADSSVREWYTNAAELRETYGSDPDVKRVVDTARGLEGLRRQDSIHAAAVVISPQPLTELVPIQQKGEDAEMVTQYEMHGIEELGLLKMDFLGLRNLATIERTLELIEASTGERIDIDQVDLQDQKTFELLCRGDTIGVFQLEGSAMRALIRSLQPDRFEDVIALVALYRPGPMSNNWHNAYAERKNGREAVDYPHPATEDALRDTFGLMIYQEQVMEIARQMAGYSMADADALRKAMGKKIPAIMKKEREKFVAGAVAQGYDEGFGAGLFDSIEGFAGYGFNKSHSACYGLVAYQTAYLKAHYPAEYMAALLTSVKRDKDKTAVYLNECRTMGVDVLTPCVNRSDMDFTVDDSKIVFGMSAIRNVGEGVVEKIVEARVGGQFSDFSDFVDRVDIGALNKRTVESLIKAGAFDSVGHARKGLFLRYDEILTAAIGRRRNEEIGQFSLFGGTGDDAIAMEAVEIPDDDWNKKVRLAFEKEMLGLYISDHPLLGVEATLRRATTCTISGLWDQQDGAEVTVGGLVSGVNRRFTRKGDPMVFFNLEDLDGAVEVVAFPRTVAESGPLIQEDAILLIRGRLDHRGDDVKMRASEIKEPDLHIDSELRLEVPATALSASTVGRLKEILINHPGSAPVFLHMKSDGGHKVLRLGEDHRVELRSALYAELRELLGPRALI